MLDLAMAQYGSFVARALLSDSRVNSAAALQHIADHKADVESTKHGPLGESKVQNVKQNQQRMNYIELYEFIFENISWIILNS